MAGMAICNGCRNVDELFANVSGLNTRTVNVRDDLEFGWMNDLKYMDKSSRIDAVRISFRIPPISSCQIKQFEGFS